MKITIDVSKMVARVEAARAREADLRTRGVALVKDWRRRMTAPINQRALQHRSPRPAPRQAEPGELLFEFYRERDHSRWRVELRDRSPWGVEAQLLRNEEFILGHRFDTRAQAEQWATTERDAILKDPDA